MVARKATATQPTRESVFLAAATLFSASGFEGVSVDDIAARAAVNKAMIYYYLDDKLALYRAVVADMLRAVGERVSELAASPAEPAVKLDLFIDSFVRLADERPWF